MVNGSVVWSEDNDSILVLFEQNDLMRKVGQFASYLYILVYAFTAPRTLNRIWLNDVKRA